MALKNTTSGDDKRTLKIGIAIGLFVIAGAVVAWQVFGSDPSTRVSEDLSKQAQAVQQAIKEANPNAPAVPDTAPKPAGRPQKSEVGRGPSQAPK